MTPRRWQNLAKYFFDVSKLILTTSVLAPLVISEKADWKVIAIGTLGGVLFFAGGIVLDRKGETS